MPHQSIAAATKAASSQADKVVRMMASRYFTAAPLSIGFGVAAHQLGIAHAVPRIGIAISGQRQRLNHGQLLMLCRFDAVLNGGQQHGQGKQ